MTPIMERLAINVVLDLLVGAMVWSLVQWHTHNHDLAYVSFVLALFLRPVKEQN
jgi:hypothetical protein